MRGHLNVSYGFKLCRTYNNKIIGLGLSVFFSNCNTCLADDNAGITSSLPGGGGGM